MFRARTFRAERARSTAETWVNLFRLSPLHVSLLLSINSVYRHVEKDRKTGGVASNNQLRVVQCPCAYPVSIRTHVLLLTCVSYIRRREKFRALSITFVVGLNGESVLNNRRQVKTTQFLWIEDYGDARKQGESVDAS